MQDTNRPLSPHVQIYRPQLTWVLSLTHRATGVVLAVGTLALVYWLTALAAGAEPFGEVRALCSAWYGRVVLLGFSFSLFYHLCNGIRHLFWDVGLGFEMRTVYKSGWAVVIASVALTLVAWVAGYAARGGV